MKRCLTLFFVFIAFVWTSDAQIILLDEGFEGISFPVGWTIIDKDGDGYNWQVISSGLNAHDGTGCVSSASFINYVGPRSPDNWLITPPITVSATADTANLTFWAVGQDPNYSGEKYGVFISTSGSAIDDFDLDNPILRATTTPVYEQKTINLLPYAGQTVYIAFRHYNITNMYRLNLDEIQISVVDSSPTVVPLPSLVDFGRLFLRDSSVQQVRISGYNLTDSITAGLLAGTSFALSVDGITFADTITLPDTGGVVYVKYLPAAGGIHNDRIILTSADAMDAVLTLTGSCIDCFAAVTFPFAESFDDDILPLCWNTLDVDGDGNSFIVVGGEENAIYAYNGHGGFIASASNDGSGTLTPDNWLITPPVILNSTHTELSFRIAGLSLDACEENYGVYVSTARNSNTTGFVPVHHGTTTADYVKHVINLDQYANDTIYIAFRHYNTTGQGWLRLDDIELEQYSEPIVEVEPEALDFKRIETGTESVKPLYVFGHILATGITASLPYGTAFSISADGIAFGQTDTLPAEGGVLFVKYNPTVANDDSSYITFSAFGAVDVVVPLAGKSVDCSVNIVLPYAEGFDDAIIPPCWTVIDADGDGHCWQGDSRYPSETAQPHNGSGMASSASFILGLGPLNPDNWLVMPPIFVGDRPVKLSFWVVGQDSLFDNYLENYGVYVSDTGSYMDSFISVYEGTATASWEQHVIDLVNYVNQTIHIAFRHYNTFDRYVLSLDDISLEETDVGIASHAVGCDVNVYPNPAATSVVVAADENIQTIAIYDLTGTRVATFGGNERRICVNISNLANGMYFLKIVTDGGTVTRKFNVLR